MRNTSGQRWLEHFRRYRSAARYLLVLSIGSALAPVAVAPALAQGARQPPANAPMPPRRPQNLEHPATPAEPQPAPRSEAEADQPLDRETLRHCASRWQAMKLDGTASGRLWRDFAKDCAAQYRRDKR